MKRRHLPLVLLLCAGCPDELPAPPTDISISPIEGPDNVVTVVTIRGDFVVARLDVDFSSSEQKTDEMIEAFLAEVELRNVKFLEAGAVTAEVPPGLEIGLYDLTLRDPNGKEAVLADAFKIRPGTCADYNFLNPGECGSACTGSPGCACVENGICGTACGDSMIRDDEMCDDGNLFPDDGCNPNCDIEPGWDCDDTGCTERCGDGIKVGREQCDDMNRVPGDGCDADCKLENTECGDGAIEGDEQCDLGPGITAPGCIDCVIQEGWDCGGVPSMCGPICGDGRILGGEKCDDDNEVNEDGCTELCEIEDGYCCRGQPSICYNTCGNGFIDDRVEQCDDGGVEEGDGCGPCCTFEPGWHCLRSPSICLQKETTSWVDDDGPSCELGGRGTGTYDDPFCQIAFAVGGPHETIAVFPGDYAPVSIEGLNHQIVAEEGVHITSGKEPAFAVVSGATVEAIGLWVSTRGTGYLVDGANSRLTIRRCKAGPMQGLGVDVRNAGHLRMDACEILECAGGGMILQSIGGYRVTNTIVAESGEGGPLGGVRILARDGESVFANNTIANNVSALDEPAAMFCGTQEPTPIVNSILWDGRGGSRVAVGGNCAPRFSAVSGSTVALDNGNIDLAPQLMANYRLEPTSPCVDAGDPEGIAPGGPAPPHDIDGDERPSGARVDIGADEVH